MTSVKKKITKMAVTLLQKQSLALALKLIASLRLKQLSHPAWLSYQI
jgi:type III secretory pathway component EscS